MKILLIILMCVGIMKGRQTMPLTKKTKAKLKELKAKKKEMDYLNRIETNRIVARGAGLTQRVKNIRKRRTALAKELYKYKKLKLD